MLPPVLQRLGRCEICYLRQSLRSLQQYIPSQDDFKSTSKREPVHSSNDWFLSTSPAKTTEATEGMSHESWVCLCLPTPDIAQFNQILSSTEALLASACNNGYT